MPTPQLSVRSERAVEVAHRLSQNTGRTIDVTVSMTDRACSAFDRFGKGADHKAALKFGDCLTYAVARELKAPLPFKGDDFGKTNVFVHQESVVL